MINDDFYLAIREIGVNPCLKKVFIGVFVPSWRKMQNKANFVTNRHKVAKAHRHIAIQQHLCASGSPCLSAYEPNY